MEARSVKFPKEIMRKIYKCFRLMKRAKSQPRMYSRDYYDSLRESSLRSGKEIVPMVIKLIQPASVIDVGCGTGVFLSVFREYGVRHILGIDGDWVKKDMLRIPQEQFMSFDLEKPFRINKKFDLVVSLEVAEHLPPPSAEVFVDSLTRLGSVILFSAAIPYQGGVGHVNEQWPEYWVKYFEKKGFVVIDCLRNKLWHNANVEWWVIQNILLFVRESCLGKYPLLKNEYKERGHSQLSIIHPKEYVRLKRQILESKCFSGKKYFSCRKIMGAFFHNIINAFK